jgi:hypothetical protein
MGQLLFSLVRKVLICGFLPQTGIVPEMYSMSRLGGRKFAPPNRYNGAKKGKKKG